MNELSPLEAMLEEGVTEKMMWMIREIFTNEVQRNLATERRQDVLVRAGKDKREQGGQDYEEREEYTFESKSARDKL